jgi:hypothetical protein
MNESGCFYLVDFLAMQRKEKYTVFLAKSGQWIVMRDGDE